MKHIPELDIMKAIGILFVVMGHVTRMYTEEGLIKPLLGSEILCMLTEIIYVFHMPLFFFVSGCVFGHQEKKSGNSMMFTKMVRKKMKRLIVPYLIFGLLYVAPFLILFGYRQNVFSYIFNGILLCHDNRHLWFIISLFTIFLVVYVFNMVLHRFRFRKHALLLLATIIYFFQDFFPGIFNLRTSACFLLWFCIGYIFSDKPKYYSSIITIASPFVCLYLFMAVIYDNNWLFPGWKFMAAMIIINLVFIVSTYLKKFYHTTVLKYLSQNCYAIFLLHPILIYLFFHVTKENAINPYLLSSCAFIFSMMGCVLIIFYIRKVNMSLIFGE